MPSRGQKHDVQGVSVLVVENVGDYRDCVPHYVTKEDIVLEVGTAQGCTTNVIAQFAKEVVGIDKSLHNAKASQNRYSSISFYQLDAWDIGGIMKLDKPFTKIFLDISGSQPIGPLASLLEKYERAFPTVNLFVVKSYRLKKLVGNSTIFPEHVLGTTSNPSAQHLIRSLGEGKASQSGGAGDEHHAANGTAGARHAPRPGLRQPALRALCCHAGAACAALAVFGAGLAIGGRRRAG